jgi:MFS family permease
MSSSATSILGRIIPPYIADYIGYCNVLSVSAMLTGASMLCLWLPFNYHSSHAGIIVFGLVYGFVSGAVVSLLLPCVAKFGELETLGRRFGTFQMVISVRYVFDILPNTANLANFINSCLTGLPIMGGILTRQSGTDFAGLQIFAAVIALIGSCCIAGSALLLSRSRQTWRV